MRRRARVAPDRRPEHERDAGGARAGVGGGQRDAARQPGDDGAEAARGGEPADARAGVGRTTGNGGSPPAIAPPWRTPPPTSANTTSSASCSAANAPMRNAGAWLVTKRTGAGRAAHRSASSYAATVARPHCSHVKPASTVARAASPSSRRQPGSSSSAAQLGGERLRVGRRHEPQPAAGRGDLLRAGLPAAADRRHRAGHRLDVGDAERLVDARQHEHAGAPARPRAPSARRRAGRGSGRARRARSSPASRSSAARSGPSPTTSQRSSGWLSRSSHSARSTSAWRLRATRWPTVTSAAAGARRRQRRQVGAEVHDLASAAAPSVAAARGDAGGVREHEPGVREARPGPRGAPAAERSATDSTSPPWTETTTGTPGRARRTASPAGAA